MLRLQLRPGTKGGFQKAIAGQAWCAMRLTRIARRSRADGQRRGPTSGWLDCRRQSAEPVQLWQSKTTAEFHIGFLVLKLRFPREMRRTGTPCSALRHFRCKRSVSLPRELPEKLHSVAPSPWQLSNLA